MRSDSSTCAGSPLAIRPATYLTSGEYASTSRSRACVSPSALYRRHMSFSSMAFTLVSRIRPPNRSRSWVSQRVHLLEPPRLYPSVCLGRADRCVAKQLLNCPQISTSFEQMGCERMPQRMRRHTSLYRRSAHPAGQAPAHVGCRKTPARLRDEHRRLGFVDER